MSRATLTFLCATILIPCSLVRAADPPSAEPMQDGKPLSQWVKQLQDDDAKKRIEAARALGVLGKRAKSAVPELTKALEDKNDWVRDWSAHCLSCIGPEAKSAIPALEKLLLKDDKAHVRYMAANALGSMRSEGKPAVAALVKALKDSDPWLRHFAAVALGSIGPAAKDAAPALADAFEDDEYVVRISAVQAAGEIGPGAKGIIPTLVQVYEENTQFSNVRKAAGEAVKKIDPEAAKKAKIE